MEPRIAVQRIYHSPQYPSHVELPVYNKNYTGVQDVKPGGANSELRVKIYPNPAVEDINVYMSRDNGTFDLVMLNDIGKEVYSAAFTNEHKINAARFDKGIYFIEVRDRKTNEKVTGKVTIQ